MYNPSQKTVIKKPKENSVIKLIDCLRKRVIGCKGKKYLLTWDLLQNFSPADLFERNCILHAECYTDITNKTLIDRLKWPADTLPEEELTKPGKRTSCSSVNNYNKEKCFFYQNESCDASLYSLRTIKRSNMRKEAIKIVDNDLLRIPFDSAFDAHAGDIKYQTAWPRMSIKFFIVLTRVTSSETTPLFL